MALRRAGRAHEDLDRTECLLDVVDHGDRLRGIDQIRDECDRRMLDVSNPRKRRVEMRAAARDERDARAFGRERLRACEADALARAGDDYDPIAKFEVHGVAFHERGSRKLASARHCMSFSRNGSVYAGLVDGITIVS